MAGDKRIAEKMRTIFATNFSYHLTRTGKTQADIAELLSVSSSTVSDWASAKKYPRMDKVQLIADYLGILKSDLTEEKPPADFGKGLSEAQQILLSLSPEKQEEAMNFIRYLAGQEEQKK